MHAHHCEYCPAPNKSSINDSCYIIISSNSGQDLTCPIDSEVRAVALNATPLSCSDQAPSKNPQPPSFSLGTEKQGRNSPFSPQHTHTQAAQAGDACNTPIATRWRSQPTQPASCRGTSESGPAVPGCQPGLSVCPGCASPGEYVPSLRHELPSPAFSPGCIHFLHCPPLFRRLHGHPPPPPPAAGGLPGGELGRGPRMAWE